MIHFQKNTGSRFAAEDARAEKESEFHTAVEERADLAEQIDEEEAELKFKLFTQACDY